VREMFHSFIRSFNLLTKEINLYTK